MFGTVVTAQVVQQVDSFKEGLVLMGPRGAVIQAQQLLQTLQKVLVVDDSIKHLCWSLTQSGHTSDTTHWTHIRHIPLEPHSLDTYQTQPSGHTSNTTQWTHIKYNPLDMHQIPLTGATHNPDKSQTSVCMTNPLEVRARFALFCKLLQSVETII